MLGGFMVALILGLGIYLLIMFGLTFWLQRYHYYKNRFYSAASPEATETACDEITVEFDAVPDPESKCRQKIQSEVGEKEQLE
jgi:hypothetical protein